MRWPGVTITREDAVDFASWIRLKLIEDDYAIFRKFRGESSLLTYLSVVIAMLARDYRVQRWGRWRPSAEARRQGPLAVRLETLVHQRGYKLEEAAEILRTAGETVLPEWQARARPRRLPVREPMRPVEVGADSLTTLEAPNASLRDSTFEASDERRRTRQALDDAIRELPLEDRLVVKLRFWEGSSVAEIARSLRLIKNASIAVWINSSIG